MLYLLDFILAFSLSVVATLFVKKLALKYKIVDDPGSKRKIHTKPIPLLGGVAVFFSFTVAILSYSFFDQQLLSGYLMPKHLLGILLGGLVLIVGGALDDKYSLKPSRQILFPIFAAIIIIASGIGIDYISNPFGEAFLLEGSRIEILNFNGTPYYLVVFADLFTFVWILGMTYTTKILDGMDGLVSGLTVIAGVIIFFLSLQDKIMQPETALLAIVMAGAFAGFLLFNFNPAKIFLGEGGSTLAGFLIGTLAIVSGGKLATALLIMSIPIIDLAFVILKRIFDKRELKAPDTKHLHFRLLRMGLSQRKTVLIMYAISATLGSVALLYEGKAKVVFLLVLGVMILLFLVIVSWWSKKKKEA
ncbi:undecaprenyl/decaprenyl-phosphate alpha-N-acetylglucosaminyl 1-phosphate transferase [Patescibacteria group bacterium]|nr:undecaprenyl/decaprenyl-phosphate alpha-N-acetylglucosaminyl 1-phosphate transferase [Patescibacteria group bacterium]